MRVQVILLRRNGARLDVPHFRDLKDVPPSWVLSGLMHWGSAHGSQGKSLNVADFRSTPGFGIKAQMFQPSVVDAQHDYIKLRGFEPVSSGDATAMVMQEWLVFPERG